MRMRKKKHGAERIAACRDLLIETPSERIADPTVFFGDRSRPLHLEIGCGKGKVIISRASANPDINYIAAEGQSSVVLRAMEKAQDSQLCNLRIFIDFIHDLRDYFEEGELSGLYLNFSDPWPKARHAKRRLTYHKNLENYRSVLGEDGFIEFKTDNADLFDFALEELEPAGWKLEAVTRDLHHDAKMMEGNIMTEYEEKFSSMGNPIYKYIIYR